MSWRRGPGGGGRGDQIPHTSLTISTSGGQISPFVARFDIIDLRHIPPLTWKLPDI